MKKKLVEFMPGPKVAKLPEEGERFVGIARMPEEGLCTVDIVDTKDKSILVRVCLTKKEWMNYYPETGEWDNRTFRTICANSEGVVWTLYRDLKVLYPSYLNRITGKQNIDQHQYRIIQQKKEAKYKKRMESLEERCKNIPDLTEEMKHWLTGYVEPFHYLYYKRRERKIQVACSNCGGERELYIRPETLEESTQPYMPQIPKHNGRNQCPMCGAVVTAKAAGKTKGVYEMKNHRYIVQPFGEDVVIRYFRSYKSISGNEQGAQENVYFLEIARTYFFENKTQIDYKKHNPYTGEDFWDDCDLYGMAHISMGAGKVYQGNLDEIEGTRFRHSQLKRAVEYNDYLNAADYLNAYQKFPQLEMLYKLNMTALARDLVESYKWTKVINPKGKTIKQIFGIPKNRFEDLRRENGDVNMLEVYQFETRLSLNLSEEQVKIFCCTQISSQDMETVLQYAGLTKLLNYIKKQAGCETEAVLTCSNASAQYRETFTRYVDYIKVCIDNERPLTDPHEVYPENITEAHNRELLLRNQNENKTAGKKKNKENPNIKKDAAEYNRKYRFENKDYLIRAPKDAAEIFMEGLVLNHCVGRAGYIEAMNRHETVILFLRRKQDKKTPYYTIEIKNGKVQQAYGYKDNKPDWDKVRPFIEEFRQNRLNANQTTAYTEAV